MAAFGLVKGANGIANARCAVKLDQGWFLGGACISIGRQNGYRLLQSQDVLHLRVISQGIQKTLFNRARITEHDVHPVSQKLFKDGKPSVFFGHRGDRGYWSFLL